MSAPDEGYLCHGSPPTQVFQFDAIGCARVAAVSRAIDTSWRSRRPVWQERLNCARAYELHYAHSTVKEFRCR